jgi:hypothetical protein
MEESLGEITACCYLRTREDFIHSSTEYKFKLNESVSLALSQTFGKVAETAISGHNYAASGASC